MADAAGGVFIDVNGFRVVRDERGEHVVFIIKIRLGSFAWTVYRRFTQFLTLGDALRRKIPDSPPCPPKRLLGAHSPEFIEQRRADLLAWVRHLARDERVCRSPEFHEFLRAEANAPPPGMVDIPAQAPFLAAAAAPANAPRAWDVDMVEGASGNAAGVALRASGGGIDLNFRGDGFTDARPADPAVRLGGGGGAHGGDAAAVGGGAADASTGSEHQGKIGLRDFSLLKVVGKGSFGKVMQVRKRDTGRIYAMKVLHKSNIVSARRIHCVYAHGRFKLTALALTPPPATFRLSATRWSTRALSATF